MQSYLISTLTIKHVHTIPVTFKVILLRNPPNGESQEKVALCHEDNTVTLTMYVWLLGHSIDDRVPQPLAHLPNSTKQLILPGKLKRTPNCPDLNKHCKLIVWFTITFDEGVTDSVASPERKDFIIKYSLNFLLKS